MWVWFPPAPPGAAAGESRGSPPRCPGPAVSRSDSGASCTVPAGNSRGSRGAATCPGTAGGKRSTLGRARCGQTLSPVPKTPAPNKTLGAESPARCWGWGWGAAGAASPHLGPAAVALGCARAPCGPSGLVPEQKSSAPRHPRKPRATAPARLSQRGFTGVQTAQPRRWMCRGRGTGEVTQGRTDTAGTLCHPRHRHPAGPLPSAQRRDLHPKRDPAAGRGAGQVAGAGRASCLAPKGNRGSKHLLGAPPTPCPPAKAPEPVSHPLRKPLPQVSQQGAEQGQGRGLSTPSKPPRGPPPCCHPAPPRGGVGGSC